MVEPAGSIGNPNGGTAPVAATAPAATGGPIRGRPITIDPSTIGNEPGPGPTGDGGSAEPKRKRGRPSNASRASAAPETSGHLDLTDILYSAHQILAAAFKADAFKIERDEAASINVALNKVSRHYDVRVAEQTVDWCNLCTVLCAVYGTRIFAARMNAPAATQQPGGEEIIIPGVGVNHMQPGQL